MAYAPARPGTALTSGSITGAVISSSSGDSAKFFIKVTSATFTGSVPVVETTGSGDTTVRYDHGDKPYYDITLQGVMLGDKGVQLQNLTQQIDGTSSSLDIRLDFKFSNYGTSNEHDFQDMPVIITQCQIQFDPKLPVVGVALQMKSMLAADKGLQGGDISA
tara:strand:+ start:11437 stop:11922 length:486 start_codon:yes stop_codon:yes gene_type:complete